MKRVLGDRFKPFLIISRSSVRIRSQMGICDSCHSGCCRSFAVPISGADIHQFTQYQNKNFWDFACRWEDSEGLISRNLAPHFFFEDAPDVPFVICLKHIPSVSFPGTTKCRFLMECLPDEDHPKGLGRCSIYHSRPHTCRSFPAKLNDDSELAILYEIPTNGRNGEPAYDLCPRQWTPADLDPNETIQSLVVAKYEMTFFKKIAVIWNQNPGPWNSFPEFINIIYANRISSGQVGNSSQDQSPDDSESLSNAS